MFGFFGLETPKQRERRRQYEKEERDLRIPLCVPWDPKVKFQKELNFKANTYKGGTCQERKGRK